MSAAPVVTTNPAILTVKKIDIAVTIAHTAVDVDDHTNLTAREVRGDAPPKAIGPNGDSSMHVDVAGSGEIDEVASNDERENSSSSQSDTSEHPDLPEGDEAPDVSIVQPEYASGYVEHTEETLSNSGKLSDS